jgi:hypothetical protein
MPSWSIASIASRIARFIKGNSHRRTPPIRKRTSLQLVPLEERIVLGAVAPGSWWDDGYYQNGVRVGVTVSLHNLGSTWLEVTGSKGAVSVAPGTAPSGGGGGEDGEIEEGTPIGGGPGGGGSGPTPTSNNYSFEVFGALGSGSGDVTWSGAANSLSIQATGDVNSIGISGTVSVVAGYSIGNLSLAFRTYEAVV